MSGCRAGRPGHVSGALPGRSGHVSPWPARRPAAVAPARALARVYRELRLGDYNASPVAAAVESYAATLRGFRKNDHRALGAGLEALVRRRWAAAFAEHGYE